MLMDTVGVLETRPDSIPTCLLGRSRTLWYVLFEFRVLVMWLSRIKLMLLGGVGSCLSRGFPSPNVLAYLSHLSIKRPSARTKFLLLDQLIDCHCTLSCTVRTATQKHSEQITQCFGLVERKGAWYLFTMNRTVDLRYPKGF